MKKKIITIDGPAGSGKEKIAKFISKKWRLKHLDSGILYRKLAFILFQNNVNLDDKIAIKKKIRTQRISKLASKIAVHDFVRAYINKLQYNFVNNYKNISGFVIDGRDIGSVVFKKADIKLYIKVNPEIRAKRRYKQLIDSGEKSIYPKILKDIKLRDKKDSLRKNSPLVIPKDAYIVNNDGSFISTIKQINNLLSKF